MKMQKLTTIAALIAITGGIPGCGGGSEGTGAFSSSFAKTTPVGELTTLDREKLCGEFADFTDRLLTPKLLCPFVGVYATILEREKDPTIPVLEYCPAIQSECEDSFDEIDFSELKDQCIIEKDELSNCRIPVGVVETCLNTVFDEFVDQLGSITCDRVTTTTLVDELIPKVSQTAHNPACEQLVRECPDDFKFGDNDNFNIRN